MQICGTSIDFTSASYLWQKTLLNLEKESDTTKKTVRCFCHYKADRIQDTLSCLSQHLTITIRWIKRKILKLDSLDKNNRVVIVKYNIVERQATLSCSRNTVTQLKRKREKKTKWKMMRIIVIVNLLKSTLLQAMLTTHAHNNAKRSPNRTTVWIKSIHTYGNMINGCNHFYILLRLSFCMATL